MKSKFSFIGLVLLVSLLIFVVPEVHAQGEIFGAKACDGVINTVVEGNSPRLNQVKPIWEKVLQDHSFAGKTWVGKLASNQKEYGTGENRLTIVFVPCTTDLTKPVEMVYFFHGIKGFAKWDLNERIAPQTKKMSQTGRNFVLVFPELPWASHVFDTDKPNSYTSKIGASTLWLPGDSNLVQLHADAKNKIQQISGLSPNIQFVSMVGHSAGGGALSLASTRPSPTNNPLMQIGVNKIVFSDADYSWKDSHNPDTSLRVHASAHQRVYENYVSKQPSVNMYMLVQDPSRVAAHSPTKHAISFGKNHGASWTVEEGKWSVNKKETYNTPGVAAGQIVKIPTAPNVYYVPLKLGHAGIGKMSLAWTDGGSSTTLPTAPASGQPATASKILLIGDSHVLGSYGKTLDQLLRSKGNQVATYGLGGSDARRWVDGMTLVGGKTSNGWHKDFSGSVKSLDPSIAYTLSSLKQSLSPSTVIISLGTNDISNIAENKENIISKIDTLAQIAASGSKCYWVGPPKTTATSVSTVYGPYDYQAHAGTAAAKIKSLAEKNGCTFIDSLPLTSTSELKQDKIHYTTLGGQNWAQNVANKISTGIPLAPTPTIVSAQTCANLKIGIVGASNTVDTGKAWSSILKKQCGNVIISAKGGKGPAYMNSNLIQKALSHTPDILIIKPSGNSLGSSNYISSITAMAVKAKAKNPNVKVVVLNNGPSKYYCYCYSKATAAKKGVNAYCLFPVSSSNYKQNQKTCGASWKEGNLKTRMEVNQQINQLKTQGTIDAVVDIYSSLGDPSDPDKCGYCGSDGGHLTSQGHQVMADVVLKTIFGQSVTPGSGTGSLVSNIVSSVTGTPQVITQEIPKALPHCELTQTCREVDEIWSNKVSLTIGGEGKNKVWAKVNGVWQWSDFKKTYYDIVTTTVAGQKVTTSPVSPQPVSPTPVSTVGVKGIYPLAMKGGDPYLRAFMRLITKREGGNKGCGIVSPYNVVVSGQVENKQHPRYMGPVAGCSGNYFKGYDGGHPKIMVRVKRYDDGTWLRSTAAGRYQFMPNTWYNEKKNRGWALKSPGGVNDFSPENQDATVHGVLQRRGIDTLLHQLGPNPESNPQFESIWLTIMRDKKIGKTWASLPYACYRAQGCHKQGSKVWHETKSVYVSLLKEELANQPVS